MSNNRPSVRLFSFTLRLNATRYLQASQWRSAAAARRTGTDLLGPPSIYDVDV